MWFADSTCSRGRSRGLRALALVATLALALGPVGCVPDYATESEAPVLFRIVSINDGAVLNSDVRLAPSAVVSDTVTVDVAVRSTNPNFSTVPQVAMAVFVEQYEIRYSRSDGRSTPGVDVPYPIAGTLSAVVDVATSGTVDLAMEVVRAQAKLEPPLINLWGTPANVLGGSALILTVQAEVTLYGHTTAGQAVKATASFQINFADYPDSGDGGGGGGGGVTPT